jgi:excisionase family DNA binding protein
MSNKSMGATMTTTSDSGYLRREEAGKYLGVSNRTVSEWQRRRIIPHVKVGRKCVLFKRADLDAAMDRFTIRAVGA